MKFKYKFPKFAELDPRIQSPEEIAQIFKNSGFKFPRDNWHHAIKMEDHCVCVFGTDYMLSYHAYPTFSVQPTKTDEQKKKAETIIRYKNERYGYIPSSNPIGPCTVYEDVEYYTLEEVGQILEPEFYRHMAKRRISKCK